MRCVAPEKLVSNTRKLRGSPPERGTPTCTSSTFTLMSSGDTRPKKAHEVDANGSVDAVNSPANAREEIRMTYVLRNPRGNSRAANARFYLQHAAEKRRSPAA